MFDLLKARLAYLPTLAWNIFLGRVLKIRRWWDEIEPQLWLGAVPLPGDADRLAALGISAVVNTCEESAGPVADYRRLGIQQLRMPTVDFTHPALADVENAVEFIENALKRGGKVYVHCKAGRGRSATVVACWLIKSRGLNRDQAQALLRQKRPHVNPRLADRPVVIEFEKRARANNRATTSSPAEPKP